MPLKKALKVIFCSFCLLAAITSAFSQTPEDLDISALLREVKQKSADNWRKMIIELPNYTYKWRIARRTKVKDGKTSEESKFYEVFYPLKCPLKKCRRVEVLLEKDGKPVAEEKIAKQRAKAGEKLEKIESDEQAQERVFNPNIPLAWMQFGYYIRRPFSERAELIVAMDGQEILEKCEFFAPMRETLNGREAIAISFRPHAGAIFSTATNYMPLAEGKIWIDAADKVLIRLAIWQKGARLSGTTSDYFLENAALVRDLTRGENGVWFPRFGRIDGLNHPNLFADMKSDFHIEYFDYHRFETEVKKVEINNSDERK